MWLKPIANSNCFRQLKLPAINIFYFIYSLAVGTDLNHSFIILLKFTAVKTAGNGYFLLNPVFKNSSG